MKSITSAANPAYRAWLKLASQPRQARTQGRTLAEGAHLAAAWRDSGRPIEAVLVRAGPSHPERDALLPALAARAPVHELAAALFDALALVEHGIGLALVVPTAPSGDGPLQGDALYLDGVQDPGNAGALLRVAAAAGVRHVLASPQTAALWAPKVLRAAQGAHLQLDLRESIAPTALVALASHWIGTALDGEPLWQAAWPQARQSRIGWIVGAEGGGMSVAAAQVCTQRVRIPMAAGVESLNVAAAAAVCLFERQRRRAAGDALSRS
ncbi:MAG: RNA methyltransferase [Burkholderiaceae bacterium]|jgi:TrmH family RNA methyltransferase|nr:RNA methyltransferase [Burkholderiaceae bacterium]